ncbi:MAG: cysteine desulfurase [Ruminobacter sp.]|uniref:cysteine desulfurase n=1 Tax=Ruminobacter sp. TaxID=2774296 RepID=UPI001B4FD0BD|nr:cysteine desulfurase [Ruminobacter sp.]MBP3748769.1 cysteine desulfurase [Ruminobacter sp.]
MTTTNSDGNFEHLAGVPSAAELTILANQLFPDLTEGVNATETGAEVADVRETEQAAYAASAETGVGALPSGVPSFNWDDPFAYGNGVPGVSGVSLVPGISGNSGSEEAVSYAPKVISAEQARELESRQKQDASTENAIVSGGQTESESSVRIGTKTLAQIREDFPILSEHINGHQLVWLDNGATTQRPQQVIDRIAHYYRYENSNVHRGAHTLAARSTDAYENARRIVKDFIGASSAQEIVFVRGTTEGINLVANSFVLPQLKPGDEIIVSILEHHANIVPWQLIAQKTGAVIKVIPCDSTGQLILSEYEKLFTARTRFVSVTHVSNVLGTVTPVEELIAIAHRHGVRILIDGAQSVAHIPVNVSAWDADFFVFSGHKIYAPTGIGVVYGKKELLQAAEPYHGGGNMIADVTFERTIYNDVPNKFEAGTGSIADAVGLGAALEYLSGIGMPCVYRREHELIQYGLKELKKIPGLTLVGTAANKSSALAFKLAGHSDDEVGKRLDSYGIAVRTGHHCAQPVLRHFGYESTVRPTLGIYNSESDIDALVRALRTFG